MCKNNVMKIRMDVIILAKFYIHVKKTSFCCKQNINTKG